MITRQCSYCGKPFQVRYESDTKKNCSQPCGAHASKNRRHGHSYRDGLNDETREYTSWLMMRRRCLRPTHIDYPRYGGRGIKIDPRWDVFENFLADMGPRPDRHSLDRIDNNADYGPSNCRWASPLEQSRNRSCVYTTEQDEVIRKMIPLGHSHRDISNVIGKSISSVGARVKRLGLVSLALPPRKSGGLNFRTIPQHSSTGATETEGGR
jgi:hypothetical protein